jgi:hypothetical protein
VESGKVTSAYTATFTAMSAMVIHGIPRGFGWSLIQTRLAAEAHLVREADRTRGESASEPRHRSGGLKPQKVRKQDARLISIDLQINKSMAGPG